MNLCRERDIYRPCIWTIPDVEESDRRGEVTCNTTDMGRSTTLTNTILVRFGFDFPDTY